MRYSVWYLGQFNEAAHLSWTEEQSLSEKIRFAVCHPSLTHMSQYLERLELWLLIYFPDIFLATTSLIDSYEVDLSKVTAHWSVHFQDKYNADILQIVLGSCSICASLLFDTYSESQWTNMKRLWTRSLTSLSLSIYFSSWCIMKHCKWMEYQGQQLRNQTCSH